MGAYNPVVRSAPDIVSGNRAPGDLNSVDVITDVDDVINWVQPNANPYLILSQKFRETRTVENYKFYFLERDEMPREATVATAAAADATSIVVNSGEGARFSAQDIVRVKKNGDLFRVTSVSTDTLTVVRNMGTSTAPALAVGDELYNLGPTAVPGGTLGAIKSISNEEFYNYLEFIREPMGWDGRTLMTALHGGPDKVVTSKSKAIEFRKSRELKMIFGKLYKSATTEETHQEGVISRIADGHTWDLNGQQLTERAFYEMLEQGMRYGAGGYKRRGAQAAGKFLFCPSKLLTEINWFAQARIQTMSGDDMYGLALKYLETPHGTVTLVHLPLFDEVDSSIAMLLDLNHIQRVVGKGRDARLFKSQQDNSADAEQWDWRVDESNTVAEPEAHVFIKGIYQGV